MVIQLSEIFGQDAALKAISKALESDTLAGTYLLVGSPGTGRSTFAKAIAAVATCLSPIQNPIDACGECASCKAIANESQPEIVLVQPKGDSIQIGQFWDRDGKKEHGVLSNSIPFAPVIGKRRVFIVEQAEKLTPSAANSLLKSLEEPPPYVLFILIASHPGRMLPTILSRAQQIRLNAVPREELTKWLIAQHKIDLKLAQSLSAYAEGKVGTALTMAQNPAVGEEIATVMTIATEFAQTPLYSALKVAEQIRKASTQISALVGEGGRTADGDEASSGKERVDRKRVALVFDLLLSFYRDLLALSVGGEACHRLVNQSQSEEWEPIATLSPPTRWIGCLDALLLARRRLDANANINLLTESLAMSLLG